MKSLLTRGSRVLALLVVMNLCMGADCARADPQPCWPAGPLQADLVEVYDASAQSTFREVWIPADLPPSCGALDGLAPGSRVDLYVSDEPTMPAGPSCIQSSATVTSAPPVAPAETGLMTSGWSLKAEGDLVLADGCRGQWAMVLIVTDGVTGTPWRAGETPPVVWVRYFHTPAAENCPTLPAGSSGSLSCADVWAGELLAP